MLAAEREVLVGILLDSLPQRVVVVDIFVNRLENTFYCALREGIGRSGISVGSVTSQNQVGKVVIAGVVGGLYPLDLAAVLFLEGVIAGVDDFILGVVVEVIIPGKPLDGCAGRRTGFGIGKLDSCAARMASESSVERVISMICRPLFPQAVTENRMTAVSTSTKILFKIDLFICSHQFLSYRCFC